jgi:transposase-like protein
MLGHGAKFDQKMEQAITALLSHRSIEDAAREVGISPNTLVRWMREPEFQAACLEARRTVFSHAIGRLQDAAGAAATTVLKIMLDPNAPAATRLRAAEVVLAQAAEAGEAEDFEERLAKLERAAGLVQNPRKRSADLTWVSGTHLPDAPTTPAQITAPAETSGDVVD